ncbi:glycosyltransferase [Chryseobacterium sp.]|uniref:glycosyltransferase n=1 Tax=Chryseobacterium sp. TaxID=1871047 RepID=UPI0011CB0901|nr:glycosyltransferase [Chryseobacterium sp.]TXF77571.1 glycosyltransferase family 1 protein [Chryseobacterium sp.]
MNSELLKEKNPDVYDMIVFCHLRWDFVYQRPQHLISRLAENQKILVVEEPVPADPDQKDPFKIREITPNLHICQPVVSDMESIGPYLRANLADLNLSVGWFYSPAFISVLDYLEFETVVYDCMDELSLFRGAPKKLVEQENELLADADVVYTGGKSLYESKKEKHHNVFCFPSSVDVAHFSNNNGENLEIPADMKNIPSPIVGYYGVIDERIDLDLLKKTAEKTPGASFVMIGPLCKISDDDLPQAENIHYLGMKSYDELPAYLQYFDIAMMPFALNDSTKFISPTKTLEYMSASKPIISTKIRDVVRDYSNCIMLVENEEDFHQAVINPKGNFVETYRNILEKTSWDVTADKMAFIIEKTLA